MTKNRRSGPLSGMRVLDLSHVMAGPVCALMLADMGADVIKIERIPVGDDSRQMLTPNIKGESAAFMMMNRNKRGLALDLKKPKGQEVLKRLVSNADALIENYRKGTMERFGLGYDVLSVINPGLIYCEVSGYGRTGPMADQGGFDLVPQGMSGLMSITGEGPGRPPVKVGAPVTDITAGLLACMGVCAAYAHKLKTGKGQRLDTSLFEAGIIQTYWQSAIAFATGVSPGPLGSAHPLSAPYQAFETSDGWITLGAPNQKTWLQFVEVLGAPEIAGDARFKDNAGRMAHQSGSRGLVRISASRTRWGTLAALRPAGRSFHMRCSASATKPRPGVSVENATPVSADAWVAGQVLQHARRRRLRCACVRAAQQGDSAGSRLSAFGD